LVFQATSRLFLFFNNLEEVKINYDSLERKRQ